MRYSICYRLLKEGVNPYLPLLEQIECTCDREAIYYSIFHKMPNGNITDELLDKMWDKLYDGNTNGDFVFWILNEDDGKYIYKNPVEDDLKWYILDFLKMGNL